MLKGNIEDDTSKNNNPKSWEEQIKVIEKAIPIFFENRFREADDTFSLDDNLDHYLYYKVARGYIGFIFAVFTMEKPYVIDAVERVNAVYAHCKKARKASSLVSWFFKTDYNDYTDEECHAEVIYGEANFISLVLTFIDDPSFLSLIKAALKLRAAYNAYSTLR